MVVLSFFFLVVQEFSKKKVHLVILSCDVSKPALFPCTMKLGQKRPLLRRRSVPTSLSDAGLGCQTCCGYCSVTPLSLPQAVGRWNLKLAELH